MYDYTAMKAMIKIFIEPYFPVLVMGRGSGKMQLCLPDKQNIKIVNHADRISQERRYPNDKK